MDTKTIFVRTDKGENETRSNTAHLNGDIKRALLMVDGKASFGEISKRAAPSLRNSLEEMFKSLEQGGFIVDNAKSSTVEDSTKTGAASKMATPFKMVTPIKKSEAKNLSELDFTGVFRAPSAEMMAAEAAKAQAVAKADEENKARALAEAEANAKRDAEAARIKLQLEAEAVRLKAEKELAQARAEAERIKQQAMAEAKAREEAERRARAESEAAKAKAEAEARARAEAERQAREEAVAARFKAQQEAEAARLKAEREAEQARAEAERIKQQAMAEAKAREEAEAARVRAEQEAARARAELEAAKAKAEAEARARAEADRQAREEAEAVRVKAQQEAEAARLKAEREAEQARAEAERIKQKAEAEARAREEAERRAREEAETARVRAEQEAARARFELEAAKAKAREEAERRAKEEAEVARVKAEQYAEAARIAAEQEKVQARIAKEQAVAEMKARLKAEAEDKAREEVHAHEEPETPRIKAEQEIVLDVGMVEAEATPRDGAERRDREEENVARRDAGPNNDSAFSKTEQERIQAQLVKDQAMILADTSLIAEQEAVRVREEFELAQQNSASEDEESEEMPRLFLDEELPRELKETDTDDSGQVQDDTENDLLQTAKQLAETIDEPKKVKPEQSNARSSSATVLFFDVVGYTKQSVKKQTVIKRQFNQLLVDCLASLDDGSHIILDTGDGAAVGFLQHPEDALDVAMQFRKSIMRNQRQDYPELKVRIGIHLGPINIVKDMNGQSNMVGDGINDAQRVMSFAGTDQIYISRSYYDYISRLSDEYAELFQYRGSLKDKHGREHPVYEYLDATEPVESIALPQARERGEPIKLEPFSFEVTPDASASVQGKQKSQQVQAEEASRASTQGRLEESKQPEGVPEIQPPPQQQGSKENQPNESAKPADAGMRMPSEEEVMELASEQAKIWMNAEQRAIETAKSNAERAAQELVEGKSRKAEGKKTAFKTRFRLLVANMPWGKLGAGIFVVLLIALFTVPFVMPTQGYATRIEQMLTSRLKQPVHIGRLEGRLLPTPRLELSDISVGAAKEIQIKTARADFPLSALFASIKPVNSLELDGVQISGAALLQATALLQQVAADAHYPVTVITLNQMQVETDGASFSGIGGKLDFGTSGNFAGAKLQAEGGKISLDIGAMADNKMPVTLALRGLALPVLPGLVFDDLNAKGYLTVDELMLAEFDTHILGGMMIGSVRVGWRSDWRANGTLIAKVIPMQNISKTMGGDLDGNVQFAMHAEKLSGLVKTAVMDGTFAIKKGIINGIDMVETTRLRSKESLPGGRTHFDDLHGEISVANGDYSFRQLQMNAGVLNATGELNIAKQQLTGRVSSELTMRGGMGRASLQVGGTTESPTLQAAN